MKNIIKSILISRKEKQRVKLISKKETINSLGHNNIKNLEIGFETENDLNLISKLIFNFFYKQDKKYIKTLSSEDISIILKNDFLLDLDRESFEIIFKFIKEHKNKFSLDFDFVRKNMYFYYSYSHGVELDFIFCRAINSFHEEYKEEILKNMKNVHHFLNFSINDYFKNSYYNNQIFNIAIIYSILVLGVEKSSQIYSIYVQEKAKIEVFTKYINKCENDLSINPKLYFKINN